MPTKRELETELKVLEANYDAQSKQMTHLLVENNRPYMDRLVDIENLLHDDITRLVQACIDTTGRVPEIHIEVESHVMCPKYKSHVKISLPVFKPENESTATQSVAVRKLIEYCMNVGDWTNRTDCKRWIVKKINDSTC